MDCMDNLVSANNIGGVKKGEEVLRGIRKSGLSKEDASNVVELSRLLRKEHAKAVLQWLLKGSGTKKKKKKEEEGRVSSWSNYFRGLDPLCLF